MSNTITHKFVSTKVQGGDATVVSKNEWNSEHVAAGGVDGDMLVRDSTQTDGVNWSSAKAPTIPATSVVASGLTLPGPRITGVKSGTVKGGAGTGSAGFTGKLLVDGNAHATTGTVLETLLLYTLPSGTLGFPRRAVRITSTWATANNANTKTAQINFGSAVIITSTTTAANLRVTINAVIMSTATTTAQSAVGMLITGAGGFVTLDTAPVEATSLAIPISFKGTTPTQAGDLSLQLALIEILN